MNLAKAVANAAAMLVLKAKNVAQVAEDTILQNRVIAAATQCALSTSQLVACTKVLILNLFISLAKQVKDIPTCRKPPKQNRMTRAIVTLYSLLCKRAIFLNSKTGLCVIS